MRVYEPVSLAFVVLVIVVDPMSNRLNCVYVCHFQLGEELVKQATRAEKEAKASQATVMISYCNDEHLSRGKPRFSLCLSETYCG